jgi:SecD/SecF fusion protein
VPALLASGLVALAFCLNWFHLGIDAPPADLFGTTELVFEIDHSRSKDPYDGQDLAEAVKRRIDPVGLLHASVQFLPEHDRVEIVMPRSRQSDADRIEDVKSLVSQQGKLEFRILANAQDDTGAITRAREWINDPANSKKLQFLNEHGAPPPGPLNADGQAEFPITLQGEAHLHAYEWLELGKQEISSLRLQNSSTSRLKEDATTTNLGKAFVPTGDDFLLYSREIPEDLCHNPQRLAPRDLAQGKKYEYFILTRKPEPNREVTGQFLAGVSRGIDDKSRCALQFALNSTGGERFFKLTSLNRPETHGTFRRQLAILFDDEIQSAPQIIDPIRGNGQLTGDFTAKQVDDLVTILRAGALPAVLRPEPVSESTSEPTVDYALYIQAIFRRAAWSVGITFCSVLVLMLAAMKLLHPTTSKPGSEPGQQALPVTDGTFRSAAASGSTGIE